MLSVQCTVCESLQSLYSPTTASTGAAVPATVDDCLELRSQLTTDAYTLTLPVNSREATLVLGQLSSPIRLLSLSRAKEMDLSGFQVHFIVKQTLSAENNGVQC